MPPLKYRADIDGLRAISIVAVLMFHAFPTALPGGFAGVDVFFVISGFLISGIIWSGLQDKTFSILHFYDRRIRRIAPALLLVLAASSALAWTFLFPSELKIFGARLLSAAGLYSNFRFWREANYFDSGSHSNFLLHIWSLSIEEQFYLCFPLILVLVSGSKKRALWLISLAGVASFITNLVIVGSDPRAAFFNPAARIWELLIGAALALGGIRWADKAKDVYAALGLFLILASFVFLNGNVAWPGAAALAPTIGAALLLAAGPSAWVNRNVLSLRAFVFVGLISYAWYLWHWPLLSALSVVTNDDANVLARILMVLISFGLAVLTYYFAERPIRRAQSIIIIPYALAGLMVISAVVGHGIYGGVSPGRLAKTTSLAPLFAAANDWNGASTGTIVPGKKEGKVLIIGDSFAQQYYPRVKEIARASDRSLAVEFAGEAGCPPLPGVSRIAAPGQCTAAIRRAYQRALEKDVDRVIFVSSWHYFYPIRQRHLNLSAVQFEHDAMLYADEDLGRKPITPGSRAFTSTFTRFESFIEELTTAGKKVYIALPTPMSDQFDPSLMIDRLRGMATTNDGMTRAEYEKSFAPMITELRRIAYASRATLIDPVADICQGEFCNSFYKDSPIFKDFGHIRPFFVRDHIKAFDSAILD